MEQTVLSDSQRKLLNGLGANGVLSGFYLAGGTALAIHLHHRYSDDFNFFSVREFDVKQLQQELLKLHSSELVLAEKGTLYMRIDGISVSCIHYPYALIYPLKKYNNGIFLASVEDIAAMKLSALIARGTKRDFIDLFILCRNKALSEIFNLYIRRFRSSASDTYLLLRSITYFADAEDDPMPVMIAPVDWETVKEFFIAEAKKIQ